MTFYENNSTRGTIKNFLQHTNPDMNIMSKTHSCWNAEYTHLMPVSNYDTQGHTNSCYNNTLGSRELYFQYNNFQICNFYNSNNWNYCNISENIYDENDQECLPLAEAQLNASSIFSDLDYDQHNCTQSIQNRNLVNGLKPPWEHFVYPIMLDESLYSDNLKYVEDESHVEHRR